MRFLSFCAKSFGHQLRFQCWNRHFSWLLLLHKLKFYSLGGGDHSESIYIRRDTNIQLGSEGVFASLVFALLFVGVVARSGVPLPTFGSGHTPEQDRVR